jgi:ABC-type nitrate/sulfonate/bicarbonate transport system permease component
MRRPSRPARSGTACISDIPAFVAVSTESRAAVAGAALRVASAIVLIASWEVVALALHDRVLPTPVAVLGRLLAEARSGELFRQTGITLARVAASFVVAMFVGTAIGIVMGARRRWDVMLDGPLLVALNMPALVIIILVFVWAGLNEFAVVVAVALNKIPTVVVSVREGARAIDVGLLQVGRAFGLSSRRVFFGTYLPQLYPYLMAATRNGIALIWKIVLVAELLGCSSGVGFKLGTFFQFFDIASILAYTAVFIALFALIETMLLRPLERRLTAWRA